MKKKALKKEEEINQILIPKLIYSIMGFQKSDAHFRTVEEFIINFLRNNSLMYIPKISEIKQTINGLYDKLRINSQSEKANLIKDYIIRLETIFKSKNANLEYLYKFLLIVIQLARSPLMTTVNLDIMREKFEERHIRIDANKILRNKNFDLKDIQIETTVKFEPVNYASSESSEEDILIDENSIKVNINDNNLNDNFYFNLDKRIQNNFLCNDDNYYNSKTNNNNTTNYKDNSNLNVNKNNDFSVNKIQGYKINMPVFDQKYKMNLFNMIIKDSKYHELVKDNLEISNNLNLKEKNNIMDYQEKVIFNNSLKLEKNINLNDKLSKDEFEKNSKILFEFFTNKLEDKNFKLKNCFAFSNLVNNNYKDDIELNDNTKKNLLHNFNSKIDEESFKNHQNNYESKFINNDSGSKYNANENKIFYVDSNFLLISVLNRLIIIKENKTIEYNEEYSFRTNNINDEPNYHVNNKNILEYFENFYCFDLDKNIQNELLSDLNIFSEKLIYLKSLGNLVNENNLTSYVVFDFVSFVNQISKVIEIILNSYLKIALWQKGKIKNPIVSFLCDADFLFYKKIFKINSTINNLNDKYQLGDSNIFDISNHFYMVNVKNNNIENNFYSDESTQKIKKEDISIEKFNKEEKEKNYISFSRNLKNYFEKLKKENLNSSFRSKKNHFQKILEEFHNCNIIKYIDWNYYSNSESELNKDENKFSHNNIRHEENDFSPFKNLTLLSLRDDLIKFYTDKIDYLITIAENMIKIKHELDTLNVYKPYLFIKEFIDFLYLFTKQYVFNQSKLNILLASEVFFSVIFSYLEIIQVFILNGNLIDTFNEFFLDHIFTKKENAKIIFNFNEKFKNFDWFNSFKIKSYSLFEIEGGCVPEIFKTDQINFKILETGKSVFLIKNLKSLDKINFEIDIDMESAKMKEIRSFVYREIFKIYNLENIQNKNFDFYEYFILEKFREDNFIEKIKYDKLEVFKSNEINKIDLIDKENNPRLINLDKQLRRTNDLLELKKNIQINSEIEFEVYKNLPYNLTKNNKAEDLLEIPNANKFEKELNVDHDIQGINFNFNFSNAGDLINQNQFNYKNILNEEDTSLMQEDLDYKNDTEINSVLMDIEDKQAFIDASNFVEKNENQMDICDDNSRHKVLKKNFSIKENLDKDPKEQVNLSLNRYNNRKIKAGSNEIDQRNKDKIISNSLNQNKDDKIIKKDPNEDDLLKTDEIKELELFTLNKINSENNKNNTNKCAVKDGKIIHNEITNLNDNTFNVENSEIELINKLDTPINLSIDYIFNNGFIKSIKSVNKSLNEKLLGYLINKEKIKDHFELCFGLLFFRAGFSMNIFVSNLLEFTQKGKISDNFFLKNLITEISLNSDLKRFHNFIRDFFYLSVNKDIVNNFDTFKIEYKPNLPISIFFDETVNTYYSAIFNFIFNIKRMNESFKLVM